MILPFKKGHTPHNKGKKGFRHKEKTRRRMSESHKGKGLGKDNPMFGTKWTEEEKKKMSKKMKGKFVGKNHPMYGRHHLPESRKRISEEMKGEKNPNFGKHPTPWNLGIPRTEEEKKKMSENRKGIPSWNKDKTGVYSEESLRRMSEGRKGKTAGKDNPMFGKKQSLEARKIIREKRLHQVFPIKDSKIEKILQEQLKKHKIKFQKHLPILGQPDLFIKPNICIFADGDYWHGWLYLQGKDFSDNKRLNNEYFKSRIQNDKKISTQLVEQEYKVLRFWEHEINENPEKCFQKIIKIIKKSKN